MKRAITIVLLFLVMFAGVFCTEKSEEERIKKIITGIQTAAREKDIRTITNHISKSYSDPQGNNFETLRALLLGYFFRYPGISGHITHLTVSVEGASARASLQAILTSGKKTGSITDAVPDEFGLYSFDVVFRKESDEWKIASARWNQVIRD